MLPRITESARAIDQEDTEGSEHGCAVSSALNARHLLRTAQGMYAKNAIVGQNSGAADSWPQFCEI